MLRITMGERTMATELNSAGRGETGSLETKGASVTTSEEKSVGPSKSVSMGSSISGGSYSGGSGSSISGASVASTISTCCVRSVTVVSRSRDSRKMTPKSGSRIAVIGPLMRSSWSLANLYSPLSFGMPRPRTVFFILSANDMFLKRFSTSFRFSSSSGIGFPSLSSSGFLLMVRGTDGNRGVVVRKPWFRRRRLTAHYAIRRNPAFS